MPPQENNNTILKVITGFIVMGSILGAVYFYQKSETEKALADEMLNTVNNDSSNINIAAEPKNMNTGTAIATSTATSTTAATTTKTVEIINATRTQATAPKPAAVVKTKYKDGTYTDIKPYMSPGGADEITISLTLKNDIISAATFTGVASNPESRNYQSFFNSGFKKEIVGKNIDSLDLKAVSGASLTTGAFMKALLDIKSEARS